MRRKGWILAALSMGVVLGLAVWGCSQRASTSQVVKLAVTENGFEPAEVEVKSGEGVTLLVTRTTDATCAKEIVFTDTGLRKELPLNQEVRIDLKPQKPGEHRYTCGMDMVSGTLRVQ